MDFFEVINQRHSIRAYKNKPVEPEKLQQVLQAVNLEPSAGNLQAYEVYLICDDKHKTALVAAANDQEFLAQAPPALVFCAHANRSAGRYQAEAESERSRSSDSSIKVEEICRISS